MARVTAEPVGPVLAVEGLRKRFGYTTAVEGVSFSVAAGETLALVGESGSGKSTVARMLVGLVRPDAGTITVDQQVVRATSARAWRRARRTVQLVFQSSGLSLDPRLRVHQVLAEPYRIARRSVDAEGIDALLGSVGLGAQLRNAYPHELSGGQRQRVAIARALASEPKVLVLDEPVTALDVSVQGQILNLLAELQERTAVAYVLIAHDLAMARRLADRVAVMQAGCIVEEAAADDV